MNELSGKEKEILLEFAKNDMRISPTAKNLFFNRNSVYYHLRKVKSKTNLDPLRFYDLVELVQVVRQNES